MSAQAEIIDLPIDGMGCAKCAQNIENALSRTSGVQKVSVDFSAKNARVEYFPSQVSMKNLESVIEKTGYKVRR